MFGLMTSEKIMTVADALVEHLLTLGVKYVFGVPGGYCFPIIESMSQSSIEYVVCRHENNAVMMAASYGRHTGQVGIALCTAGPGVTNAMSALLTANDENYSVILISGLVPSCVASRKVHQNLDFMGLSKPITKASYVVNQASLLDETIMNAYIEANKNPKGAVMIGMPLDVQQMQFNSVGDFVLPDVPISSIFEDSAKPCADIIFKSKNPVILLGGRATTEQISNQLRSFVEKTHIPVISTFQSAGMLGMDLIEFFVGRVGYLDNSSVDVFLKKSDCVIAIGYAFSEYSPDCWTRSNNGLKKIIHIDFECPNLESNYIPQTILCGDIAQSIYRLSECMSSFKYQWSDEDHSLRIYSDYTKLVDSLHAKSGLVHPILFLSKLQKFVTDDIIFCIDVGTVYFYFGRYFLIDHAHQLMISDCQQTLGCSLPMAIGAAFAKPQHTIISVSGDGGFLMTSMDFETAVRNHLNVIHFVWNDGSYNMIDEMQKLRFHRACNSRFVNTDYAIYAKSFGALGLYLNDIDQFNDVMKQALAHKGPVLIDVAIDYTDNGSLYHL